ncbi:8660_t:CDS:1, partial [Racocetra persica]
FTWSKLIKVKHSSIYVVEVDKSKAFEYLRGSKSIRIKHLSIYVVEVDKRKAFEYLR